MKIFSRIFICYALSLALGLESFAGADNSQKSGSIPNAVNQSSEVTRADLQAFKNEKSWPLEEKVYGPLKDYIADSLGLVSPKGKAVFLAKEQASSYQIWQYFIHCYYMVAFAKQGNLEAAFLHRDYALTSFVDLIYGYGLYNMSALSNAELEALTKAIWQWVFASVGPATSTERERVLFILRDYKTILADSRSAKFNSGIYKKTTERARAIYAYAKGSGAIVGSVVMGAGAGLILGVKSIDIHNAEGIVLAGLGAITALAPLQELFIHPLSAVNNRRRFQIAKSMNSYFDYQLDRKLLEKIEFIPQYPFPEDEATKVRPPAQTYSVDSLKDILLSNVPLDNTAQSLFLSTAEDEKSSDSINQVVGDSPELLQLAAKGKNFRTGYLQQMSADFASDFASIVDPELGILENIMTAQRTVQERKFVEMSFARAERLALEETRRRFQLPESVDTLQLEEQKFKSDQDLLVYGYFKRRFFTLQQAQEQKSANADLDVKNVKAGIEKEISRLRILNFIKGLEFYSQNNPQQTELKFRTEQGVVSLSIQALLSSNIRIQKADEISRAITNPKVRRYNQRSFGPNLLSSDEDSRKNIDYYSVLPITPKLMNRALLLIVNGLTYSLTEMQFSRLMYELSPLHYSFDETHAVRDRYLVELSRRDALLADAGAFIEEKADRNTNELLARIKSHIAGRHQLSEQSKTLTEELRDNPRALLDLGALNDIRWWGYARHADYWRTREGDTKNLKENSQYRKKKLLGLFSHKIYADTKILRTPKQAEKAEKKAEKNLKGIVENRLASYGQRIINYGKAVLRTMGYTALAGAVLISNEIHFKPQIQHFLDIHAAWMAKSDGPADVLNMSIDKPGNNSKDSEDAQKNAPPSFEISNYYQLPLPHYLNLAVKENLPINLEQEEKKALLGQSSELERIRIPNVYPMERDTVEVETQKPILVQGTFLQIPNLSGFKIIGLKIGYGYTSPDSYDVFYDNRSGLAYVRVNNVDAVGNSVSGITVEFAPDKRIQAYSKQDWTLNKTEQLHTLNGDLEKIGATQLSRKLEDFASNSTEDIQSLAQKFRQSGMYTYDKEAFDYWPFSFQPFHSYQKFLRDGVFYYQCTGSNSLLADYLTNYYQYADPDVLIEPLVGYVISDGKVGNIGHKHALATRRSVPFHFVEIDGVPETMDPKYAGEEKPIDVKVAKSDDKKNQDVDSDQNPDSDESLGSKVSKASLPTSFPVDIVLPTSVRVVRKDEELIEDGDSLAAESSAVKPPVDKVVHLNALVDAVKDRIRSMEKESGVHPYEDSQVLRKSMSLIPYFRTYLIDGKTDDLIKQFIKVKYDLRSSMNSAQEGFVDQKLTELRAQSLGDDSELLHELARQLLQDYTTEATSMIGDRNTSSADPVLFKAMTNYLQFLINPAQAPGGAPRCESVLI